MLEPQERTAGSSAAGASRWRSGASPRRPVTPGRSRPRADRRGADPRRGDGRDRARRSFRHEFPPSSASSTFELTGGDDWLGPIPVERVDRPVAGRRPSSASASPAPPTSGFRAVEDPRQHLVFLPDTEVELTLVGSEPLAGRPPEGPSRAAARRWTASTPGRSPPAGPSARRRRWRSCSPRARPGWTRKPAFLSLGLLQGPRAAGHAPGRRGRRPRHAGRHDPALRRRDRRPRAGGAPAPGRADDHRRARRPSPNDDAGRRSPLPLAADGGRAVLDHQARHDVDLQADPPAVGTILRFAGRGRGPLRPGRPGRPVGRRSSSRSSRPTSCSTRS